MEGLRDTGYSFETAVADLVDNSIAAGAENIDIQVRLDFRGKISLSIADDGTGMDQDGLEQAMKYGSPTRSDPASLGKYGLGLKTASTAFCRCLSVISRASAEAPPLMATWDLDHVISKSQWLLLVSEEPDEEALEHLEEVATKHSGTVVFWRKVDRLLRAYQDPAGAPAKRALEKHRGRLKDHIASTYQRFLDTADDRAHNINISLNGDHINAWDPFQRGFSELVAEETRSVDVQNGQANFTVRAFILPRRDELETDQAKEAKLSSEKQGIYIYRENRLIHPASWLSMFQKEPHGTLLRVEFSFDHLLDEAFNLDIKKSQIILDQALWDFLKDQFLPAPRREANRRYREGNQKKISDDTKSAHDASNRSIASKEAQIGGAKISVKDPKTGEVTITNQHGEVPFKLRIKSADKPEQICIRPADNLDDGLLFGPALIDMHKAVEINTRHPYYHKVYVPNLKRSVTVQGMDSLLWALCAAELNATSSPVTSAAFEDMRFEVSRILRKLVESLPEPDLEDDTDAQ